MDAAEKSQRTRRASGKIVIILMIAAAFAIGYYAADLRRAADLPVAPQQAASTTETSDKAEAAQKPAEWWTCSMHPQIRLPNPGKCPICYMDLIPLETQEHAHDEGEAPRYVMSEAAKKLAEVQTDEVKRERASIIVRMVGLVYADETRAAALTSRVDGRLDEIYINFTGVRVNKGDPMVKIWSPTLIKSQVELFETLRSSEPDPSVIKGAEEKLIQYGLTPEQIEEIKEKKKPNLYVTLRAPINGVVTKKNALLGQFVKEGSEMYIIDDLSNVWVKMDAYESDIPWIRYGQTVRFTTRAMPGRTFSGKVQFIDPMVDMRTRSVKIRVEAPNPDLSLKPGMFVSGELEAEIDASGRVIKSEWAGKYICPVHPTDDGSTQPGFCPDSKMALQPASYFGYADDPHPQLPLVIPASAALVTGKRAIVYVEVPADKPSYEGREVVLGPKAGTKYVVYEGLREGERVVTKGNFKIDSAMQILAKPSMMGAPPSKPDQAVKEESDEEVVTRLEAPKPFLAQLTPVIDGYLSLADALVNAKVEDSARLADELAAVVNRVKGDLLEPKARSFWKKQSRHMITRLKMLSAAKEIEKQRKAFDQLSDALSRSVMAFRHVKAGPLYLLYCPDALSRQGAYWLQTTPEPRNPYFGETTVKGQNMLTCGELTETIQPEGAPGEQHAEDSAPQPADKGGHSGHGGGK